jgi:hypothetical protein
VHPVVEMLTTPNNLCCEAKMTLQYQAQHAALHSLMVIRYTLTDFPNAGSIQDGHKFKKRDYT